MMTVDHDRSLCHRGGGRTRGTRFVRRIPAADPTDHAVGVVGRADLAGAAAVSQGACRRQAPDARYRHPRPARQELVRGGFHRLDRRQEPGPQNDLCVLRGGLGHVAEPQPAAHLRKPSVSWYFPQHPHRHQGLADEHQPDRVCRPQRKLQEYQRRRSGHWNGIEPGRRRRSGEGPGRGPVEDRPRPHLGLVRRRFHDPLRHRQRADHGRDAMAHRRPDRPVDRQRTQAAHADVPGDRGSGRRVPAQGRGTVPRAQTARLSARAKEV